MTSRQALHHLIDALPDETADEAARRLVALMDTQQCAAALRSHLGFDQLAELVAWLQEDLNPLQRSLLCAPFDDEPTTSEEEAAVADARQELAEGNGRAL